MENAIPPLLQQFGFLFVEYGRGVWLYGTVWLAWVGNVLRSLFLFACFTALSWPLAFPAACAVLLWLSVGISVAGSLELGYRRRKRREEKVMTHFRDAMVTRQLFCLREEDGTGRTQGADGPLHATAASVPPRPEMIPCGRVRLPRSTRWCLKPIRHRCVVVVGGDFARSPRMQYHATSLARCGYFDHVMLVGFTEKNALSEALLQAGKGKSEKTAGASRRRAEKEGEEYAWWNGKMWCVVEEEEEASPHHHKGEEDLHGVSALGGRGTHPLPGKMGEENALDPHHGSSHKEEDGPILETSSTVGMALDTFHAEGRSSCPPRGEKPTAGHHHHYREDEETHRHDPSEKCNISGEWETPVFRVLHSTWTRSSTVPVSPTEEAAMPCRRIRLLPPPFLLSSASSVSSSVVREFASIYESSGCFLDTSSLVPSPQPPQWITRFFSLFPGAWSRRLLWVCCTAYRVVHMMYIFFSLLMRGMMLHINKDGQLEVTSCVFFQTPPCIPVLVLANYVVRPLATVYNLCYYYGLLLPASFFSTHGCHGMLFARSPILSSYVEKDDYNNSTNENGVERRQGEKRSTSPGATSATKERKKNDEVVETTHPAVVRLSPPPPSPSSSSVVERMRTVFWMHPFFHPLCVVDWHNYGYTLLDARQCPNIIRRVYRFVELRYCSGNVNLTVSRAMQQSLTQLLHHPPSRPLRESSHTVNTSGPMGSIRTFTSSSSDPPLHHRDEPNNNNEKTTTTEKKKRLRPTQWLHASHVHVLYDVAPAFFAPASRGTFLREVVRPTMGGEGEKPNAPPTPSSPPPPPRSASSAASFLVRTEAVLPTRFSRQSSTAEASRSMSPPPQEWLDEEVVEDVGLYTQRTSVGKGKAAEVDGMRRRRRRDEGSGTVPYEGDHREPTGVVPEAPFPSSSSSSPPHSSREATPSAALKETNAKERPRSAERRHPARTPSEQHRRGSHLDHHRTDPRRARHRWCRSSSTLLALPTNHRAKEERRLQNLTDASDTVPKPKKKGHHAQERWGIAPPPPWVWEEYAERQHWEAFSHPPKEEEDNAHHSHSSSASASTSSSSSSSSFSSSVPRSGRRRPSRPPPIPFPRSCVGRKGIIVVGSTSWTPDDDYSLVIEALQRLDFRLSFRLREMHSHTQQAATPLRHVSLSFPSSLAAAEVAPRFASTSSTSSSSSSPSYSRSSTLLDVWVLITGKGPARAKFEEQVKAAGLSSHVVVSTIYLQSYQQYSITLGAADVGLCMHQSSSGLDLPMKGVDMLGAGLPVVALEYAAISELLGGTATVEERERRTKEKENDTLHHRHPHPVGPWPRERRRRDPPRHRASKGDSEGGGGSRRHGRGTRWPERGETQSDSWPLLHGREEEVEAPPACPSHATTDGLHPSPAFSSLVSSAVPSADTHTIQYFPYGWSFRTAEDLEELLAVFIGFPPSSSVMKDPCWCANVNVEDCPFADPSHLHSDMWQRAIPSVLCHAFPSSAPASPFQSSSPISSSYCRGGLGRAYWGEGSGGGPCALDATRIPMGYGGMPADRRPPWHHRRGRISPSVEEDEGRDAIRIPQKRRKRAFSVPEDHHWWWWSLHLLLARRRVQKRRQKRRTTSSGPPPPSLYQGTRDETNPHACVVPTGPTRMGNDKEDPHCGDWDDQWSKVVTPIVMELMDAVHFPSFISE